MTNIHSYTQFENILQHSFRDTINRAESTEDVKKFFVQTITKLFNEVFEGKLDLEYEDIKLVPEAAPHFKIDTRLSSQQLFAHIWESSDLQNIVGRFATSAVNRFKHLSKNPDKTEAKIRMTK